MMRRASIAALILALLSLPADAGQRRFDVELVLRAAAIAAIGAILSQLPPPQRVQYYIPRRYQEQYRESLRHPQPLPPPPQPPLYPQQPLPPPSLPPVATVPLPNAPPPPVIPTPNIPLPRTTPPVLSPRDAYCSESEANARTPLCRSYPRIQR